MILLSTRPMNATGARHPEDDLPGKRATNKSDLGRVLIRLMSLGQNSLQTILLKECLAKCRQGTAGKTGKETVNGLVCFLPGLVAVARRSRAHDTGRPGPRGIAP